MNEAIRANSPARVARRMRTEIPTPVHVVYALTLGHDACAEQLMEHPGLTLDTPCGLWFHRSEETVLGEIRVTSVYASLLRDCFELFEN